MSLIHSFLESMTLQTSTPCLSTNSGCHNMFILGGLRMFKYLVYQVSKRWHLWGWTEGIPNLEGSGMNNPPRIAYPGDEKLPGRDRGTNEE